MFGQSQYPDSYPRPTRDALIEELALVAVRLIVFVLLSRRFGGR